MSEESIDAVQAVRRAAQRLSRRLRAERPTGGLTDLQLVVLAAVMDHGPMTSAGLSTVLRTTPQALTRTIASLVDAELVHRAPMPDDNRQYSLTISPVGWRALAADAAPRDAWLAGAMSSLTDAERDLLVIAASLMTRLARGDADASTGTNTDASTDASTDANTDRRPIEGSTPEEPS